jgi:hypothetical protein
MRIIYTVSGVTELSKFVAGKGVAEGSEVNSGIQAMPGYPRFQQVIEVIYTLRAA